MIAILFASASIDFWTVMRFFGSRGLAAPADAWQDHVFSHALPFYLFDLPFYSDLLELCLCAGDSLRRAFLGHGARHGSWSNASAYGQLLDGSNRAD